MFSVFPQFPKINFEVFLDIFSTFFKIPKNFLNSLKLKFPFNIPKIFRSYSKVILIILFCFCDILNQNHFNFPQNFYKFSLSVPQIFYNYFDFFFYYFSKTAFRVFRNFCKNILRSFCRHCLSRKTLKWEIDEMKKTFSPPSLSPSIFAFQLKTK